MGTPKTRKGTLKLLNMSANLSAVEQFLRANSMHNRLCDGVYKLVNTAISLRKKERKSIYRFLLLCIVLSIARRSVFIRVTLC